MPLDLHNQTTNMSCQDCHDCKDHLARCLDQQDMLQGELDTVQSAQAEFATADELHAEAQDINGRLDDHENELCTLDQRLDQRLDSVDTRQDDFEHDLGGRITNLETAAHFDGTVAEVREELHDQGEVVQAVADVIFDRMSNLEAGARQLSHRADLSMDKVAAMGRDLTSNELWTEALHDDIVQINKNLQGVHNVLLDLARLGALSRRRANSMISRQEMLEEAFNLLPVGLASNEMLDSVVKLSRKGQKRSCPSAMTTPQPRRRSPRNIKVESGPEDA